MSDWNVVLPSKPKVVDEHDTVGVYEIDGLYPGYGHTLGNSLRRIILSSLPGAAITHVKIEGADHEFSTLQGVSEDVVTILLNLKRIRIKMLTDEPQTLTIDCKGPKEITAKDIDAPGQVEIINKDQIIANLTDKNISFKAELRVEKGIGFVAKENLQRDRIDIGAIALDASFTPIRRVNYEVENMRVGNRTDFNRLKIFIETDGIIMPREALEKSIEIMINQLKSIIGFKEEELPMHHKEETETVSEKVSSIDPEILKTRIENLNLSQRSINALAAANIRTLGGLARKREEDILDVDGLGSKGIQEIKKMLSEHGITLK
jgi:DNA-directed RNA polymerase subunit alpha